MFPNSASDGLDRLLPLVVFAIVGSDSRLAALAYRHDIGATVRARSVIEPWAISIGAFAFAFYSTPDGLIRPYLVSLLAALDRKSVVSGKGVSVRVGLGRCR